MKANIETALKDMFDLANSVAGGKETIVGAKFDHDGDLIIITKAERKTIHWTIGVFDKPMEFSAVLRIPHQYVETINSYLEAEEENDFQGEAGTIINTVIFPDGAVMDIKCCGCDDESSWTDAVLFVRSDDGNLCQAAYAEPNDSYTGEWALDYEGRTYRVNVIDGGDIDKVQLEPVSAPDGMTTGWAVDCQKI